MRRSFGLVLLLVVPFSSFAQSPFQFHEVSLLGTRMWHSGEDYSAMHAQIYGRQGPSPANRMIPDFTDLEVYRSSRWLGLLAETDGYRRNGAFDLAERQYLDLLSMLRQVQGPTAVDVGWMLDRLGDFYLESRDFDKAYQNFADALKLRRTNIDDLHKTPANQQVAALLVTCRAHVVRLLVALGRLDFAKGNLVQADKELAEAVNIGNELARLQDGLQAVYFQSLVLEKQGKYKEAEAVWQQAEKLREKMTLSAPYWNVVEDMAAFYARRGDFQTAATLAKRVQSEIADQKLKPVLGIPDSLDGRMDRAGDVGLTDMLFRVESNIAMSEIVAIDRWIKDGPDASAPLLSAKTVKGISMEESTLLGRGSDPQRARLLSFLTQRAFLRMSVLLDGNPSVERVQQAYTELQTVKGRYLDTMGQITMLAEYDRNNPHVSSFAYLSAPFMLDNLAKERTRHAHFFVAAALDGKKFSNEEFAASEEAEQAVSEGLAHRKENDIYELTAPENPNSAIPQDSVLVDMIAWERTDRSSPTLTHREYGAFVMKKGQPIKFVRLGSAAAIDQDVATLENVVVGPRVRGAKASPQSQAAGVEETNQRLKHLYQEVMAPLEDSFSGTKKLLIIPDGKLTLVPMEAFMDKQGQYLLQRYTVSYLNSWRSLNFIGHGSIEGNNPSVVVANPDFNSVLPGSSPLPVVPGRLQFESLPGAEQEAKDVEQALHLSQDRVLVGQAAREELIRALNGPEVLHFATHSVPNLDWKIPVPNYDLFDFPRSLAMDDPLLQSVIVLAGGSRPQAGPEDGLLTGLEIASLRLLGTKLVVLSTCEAGQGTPVDGQGVLGLRAAFSIAGAQGLVMSLWPVDDKAGRLFMQFFYSHLVAGPAEAVRQAQLDMVSKTEYKQPRYWAGYSYSGDPTVKIDMSAPKPASGGELLTAPSCFQVKAHNSTGDWRIETTYRVRVATIRQSSSSPEKVVYELVAPGSDLEHSSAVIGEKGPPVVNPDPEVHIASQHNFPVSISIERTKDHSAMYIREYVADGDHRYKPDTVTMIALQGPPNLFSGFEIPASLPPLSSFKEVFISGSGNKRSDDVVDNIGACTAPQ
jgi:CHAT domain-containing protein